MKSLLHIRTVAFVMFASLCADAAPKVSNVQMSQAKMTSNVTVTYDLSDEDAVVTFDILTNGVSIGAANVTHAVGDVNRVVKTGTGKKIIWSSYNSWPDRVIKDGSVQAVVTAWSLDCPPPVMAVDLLHKSNIVFYASVDQLPGGVTNIAYKTDWLVMRKIPARGCTYTKGATVAENSAGTGGTRPHMVAFTNDFYLGIYEMTQKQLFNVAGVRCSSNFTNRADSDCLPCDTVAWGRSASIGTLDSLRDWHNNIHGSVHPQGMVSLADDNSLSLNMHSLLYKLAHHAGIAFDLPTSAQWEYACRAGSAARFNNGSMTDMDKLGWYVDNSEDTPHPVGLKAENAFGLYDMHGNVCEWVLDYAYTDAAHDKSTDYDIEPAGHSPNGSYLKECRGGSYKSERYSCGAVSYTSMGVNYIPVHGDAVGFRLWAPGSLR